MALAKSLDSQVASATFHTPRDFSLKLNIVTNAARTFLGPKQIEIFKKLRIRCDAESQFRNAFVHFTFVTDAESGRAYLRPNPWNINIFYRKSQIVPEEISIQDLKEAKSRFANLARDLEEFSQQIPLRAVRPQVHFSITAEQRQTPPPHRTRRPKSRRKPPRSSSG